MTTHSTTNPFDALDKYALELLFESVTDNRKLLCELAAAKDKELEALEAKVDALLPETYDLDRKVQDQFALCEQIREALYRKS